MMSSTKILSAACACLLLFTCGHATLNLYRTASEGAEGSEAQKNTSRVRVACAISEADFGHGVVRVARAEPDTTRDRTLAADPSPGDDGADFGADIDAWKAAWAACVNHVGRRLSALRGGAGTARSICIR